MKLLLDSQILLWAAAQPDRLSEVALQLLEDASNELIFSAASLWEITIKAGLGRQDFSVDAALLRRGLLENDYSELPITSRHAVGVGSLPAIHRDPFDRLLVAQALSEGITLVTADRRLAEYPGPIRQV